VTVSSLSSRSSAEPGRGFFPGLAASTLITTGLLILVGGVVRVSGHGLGCPDWPLCYGRAIPPGLTGAWVEFTHRLVSTAAGAQIVLLGALAWRRHRGEKWIWRPALAAVALLAAQVPLGGLHVIMENPPETGLAHTALAMLILGCLAVLAAAVLPVGERLQKAAARELARGRLAGLISLLAGLSYLLLLTGSLVTRSGASLACPAFPWCGAVSTRLADIQMLHRLTALAVAGLALVVIVQVWRRARATLLSRFAQLLLGILLCQLALGAANVLLRLPLWTRVLHLTVGAAWWAAVAMLWTVVSRGRSLSRAETEPAPIDESSAGRR
jgi:heme A synthase